MRFIHSILAFLVLGSIVGCGGLFGGKGGSSRRALPPATGGVAGTLARDAGGTVAFIYDTVPAGSTPIANAAVTVAQAGSATTDVDGKFALTRILAGHRTLHVQIPGGASFDVPLTIFPNATVQLGAPPFTRDQAINAAKAWISGNVDISTVDVYAAQQPLPTGAQVQSSLHFDAPAPLYTAASPQWLVYCDVFPSARFAHDTYYVLVDANTGALNPISTDCYPLVNEMWFYSERKPENEPDVVSLATRAKTPIGQVKRLTIPITRGRDHVDDPNHAGRTYALVIGGTDEDGSDRSDMNADVNNAPRLFGNAALPPLGKIVNYAFDGAIANWEKRYPPPSGYPLGDYPDSSQIRPRLTADIQTNLDAIFAGLKSIDTFVLYVTSHGSNNEGGFKFYIPFNRAYHPKRDAAGNLVLYEGRPDYECSTINLCGIYTKDLDFSKCKACHIVIITDCCYSNTMVADMIPAFQNSTGKEVVLLGAATGKAWGTSNTQLVVPGPNGPITFPTGGALSTGLRKAFADPSFTGGLYAGMTTAVNSATIPTQAAFQQVPRLWTRTLADGEFCDTGSQTVTIRSKAGVLK